MNPQRGRLALLIRFAVAAGIIAWLLQRITISQVVSAVAQAKPGYLCLALGTVLISMALEAFRVRIMARVHGVDASTMSVLAIDLAASFYGLFVPGGTLSRGAIRVYRLSTLGAGPSAAGVVILRDRLDSTAVLAIVGLCFLAVAGPANSGTVFLLMAGTLAVSVLFYSIVFAPDRWRLRLPWDRIPGGKRLQGLRESIGRMRAIPVATQATLLGICILMHLFIVLMFYLIAKSLGLEVPLVTIAWIRSVVTLVTMIPVTFGGVGVREAALLIFLRPYGVHEDQAVAYGFLIFVMILVFPGILGGLLEGWSTLINSRARAKRNPASSR